MPKQIATANRCLLALIVVALAGCTTQESQTLSYDRALEISRDAAKKHGYDLSKYALDTFGDPAADKDKWLIAYQCVPAPAHPGCMFLVAVDRKTGTAEVYPGE